ncbi:MAG: hypothetical protein AAGE94_04140, partial [Acidobacteriota bacterium]
MPIHDSHHALLTRSLYILLALLVAWPGALLAHPDEAGEPIMVSATIDEGIVQGLDGGPANYDDGWDLEAEFLLTTTWVHSGHGVEVSEAGTYANTSASPILDLFDYYSHPECTDREPILQISTLIEVDTEFSDHVLFKWMQVGVGLALSGYGAPAAAAVFVGGGAMSLAMVLNGSDDFGTVITWVPADSTTLMEFKGADGAAILPLTGRVSSTDVITCFAPVTTVASVTVAERAEAYDTLREAIAQIPNVDVEAGNPAGLSEQDVDDLRAALTSMVVTMAELQAGFEVEAAAAYAGNEDAVAFLAEAEAAVADGESVDAIELYALAFETAARAIEEGEKGAGATIEPRIVPLTSVHAPREGRTF